MTPKSHYILDAAHTDPKRLKAERDKARDLKKTAWWTARVQKGICHYCGKTFPPKLLTLDHVVPLARGGTSTKGNCVPACKSCNENKKLDTPVDSLFEALEAERMAKAQSDKGDGSFDEGDNS